MINQGMHPMYVNCCGGSSVQQAQTGSTQQLYIIKMHSIHQSTLLQTLQRAGYECNEVTAAAAWTLETALRQTTDDRRLPEHLPSAHTTHITLDQAATQHVHKRLANQQTVSTSVLTAAYVLRCQELLATFEEVQARLEQQASTAWPHGTTDMPSAASPDNHVHMVLDALSTHLQQELAKHTPSSIATPLNGLTAIDLRHVADPAWLTAQVLSLPQWHTAQHMPYSQLLTCMQDALHKQASHMQQGSPAKALQELWAAMQHHMETAQGPSANAHTAQGPSATSDTAQALEQELHAWRVRHVEQCCAVNGILESCAQVEEEMEEMVQELRRLTSAECAGGLGMEAESVGMQASMQSMQKDAAALAQELLQGRQQDHTLQQQLDDIQHLTRQHEHHDASITGLMQLIDRLTKQLTTVNDATIAQLQGPTKQQLHGTSTRLRSAQDVIAQEIKGFMDSTHPAGTSCGAGGVGMDDALVVAVNRVRQACDAATHAIHDTESAQKPIIDTLLHQTATSVDQVEGVRQWSTAEAAQSLSTAAQACRKALEQDVPAATGALEEWWEQPALEALPWVTVEGRTASEWCQHILEAAATNKNATAP